MIYIPKDKIKGLNFGHLIVAALRHNRKANVSCNEMIDVLGAISNEELERVIQEFVAFRGEDDEPVEKKSCCEYHDEDLLEKEMCAFECRELPKCDWCKRKGYNHSHKAEHVEEEKPFKVESHYACTEAGAPFCHKCYYKKDLPVEGLPERITLKEIGEYAARTDCKVQEALGWVLLAKYNKLIPYLKSHKHWIEGG